MATNRNFVVYNDHFRKADESVEIVALGETGSTIVSFFKDGDWIIFASLLDFAYYEVGDENNTPRIYCDESEYEDIITNDSIDSFEDIKKLMPDNYAE